MTGVATFTLDRLLLIERADVIRGRVGQTDKQIDRQTSTNTLVFLYPILSHFLGDGMPH